MMNAEFLVDDWEVRPFQNSLVRDDHTARIEPKAMQVLVYLAEHPGEVVRKETLMDNVWEGSHVTDEVLTNAIWEIRKTLGDNPKTPRFIQTVPTKGYRFIATVSPKEVPADGRGNWLAGLRNLLALDTHKSALAKRVVPAWAFAMVVTALLVALTVIAYRIVTKQPAPAPETVTHLLASVRGDLQGPTLTISPNGKNLVYAASDDEGPGTRLYRRPIDSHRAVQIAGTDGAFSPFFSPDGRSVGFFTEGKLKHVSLDGGLPTTVCDCSGYGAAWGSDDTIVIGGSTDRGLSIVSAHGGEPSVLTKVDPQKGEVAHTWPDFLPSGKAVVFMIYKGSGAGQGSIAVESLETGQRTELVKGAGYARFAPTGHLVYGRGGSLVAVPFDVKELKTTATPVPVLEGVATLTQRQSAAWFAFSRSGTLVYIPGSAQPDRSVVWVDRSGKTEPLMQNHRNYYTPRLSSDGKRLAVVILEDNAYNIWLLNLTRPRLTRLTLHGSNVGPLWSPDGQRLAFMSNRDGGPFNLFVKGLNGDARVEAIATSASTRIPNSWTPDGRKLFYAERRPGTGWDSFLVSVGEDIITPILDSPFDEESLRLSPDGTLVAFTCNESGQREVYVRSLSDTGSPVQVSTDGGSEPVWSHAGSELFYRSGNRGQRMMSVEIEQETSFAVGVPRLLFEGDFGFGIPGGQPNFDVTADGERFVMIRNHRRATTELHYVLNWFAELEQKVPSSPR